MHDLEADVAFCAMLRDSRRLGFFLVPVFLEQEQREMNLEARLLPKRWIVERTFAWLGRYRRPGKDYEGLPATSETWIRLAMIDRMLHRRSSA